jgi:hypothetical protein
MALYVLTSNPVGLLAAIKKLIADKTIATWEVDSAGDFTHSPQQWRNSAWLRPTIGQNQLQFNIVKPKDIQLTWEVYGVYHGRFCETLIVHFHDQIGTISATPKPASGDIV